MMLITGVPFQFATDDPAQNDNGSDVVNAIAPTDQTTTPALLQPDSAGLQSNAPAFRSAASSQPAIAPWVNPLPKVIRMGETVTARELGIPDPQPGYYLSYEVRGDIFNSQYESSSLGYPVNELVSITTNKLSECSEYVADGDNMNRIVVTEMICDFGEEPVEQPAATPRTMTIELVVLPKVDQFELSTSATAAKGDTSDIVLETGSLAKKTRQQLFLRGFMDEGTEVENLGAALEASGLQYEFSSSDEAVANVSSDGIITPVEGAEGKSAVIKCTVRCMNRDEEARSMTADGRHYIRVLERKVVVKKATLGVTLTVDEDPGVAPEEVKVYVGQTKTLTVGVEEGVMVPITGYGILTADENGTVVTSDKSTVTHIGNSEKFLFKAMKPGVQWLNAEVMHGTNNETSSKSYRINILPAPTMTITTDIAPGTVPKVGDVVTMTAQFSGIDMTNPKVQWKTTGSIAPEGSASGKSFKYKILRYNELGIQATASVSSPVELAVKYTHPIQKPALQLKSDKPGNAAYLGDRVWMEVSFDIQDKSAWTSVTWTFGNSLGLDIDEMRKILPPLDGIRPVDDVKAKILDGTEKTLIDSEQQAMMEEYLKELAKSHSVMVPGIYKIPLKVLSYPVDQNDSKVRVISERRPEPKFMAAAPFGDSDEKKVILKPDASNPREMAVPTELVLTILRPATGITLEPSSATLEVGTAAVKKSQQLVKTLVSLPGSAQSFNWKSSNPAVATVDQNGLVNAVSEGSATITVATADGDFSANALIQVITVNRTGNSDGGRRDDDRQQQAVELVVTENTPLGFAKTKRPLIKGYPDRTFKPDQLITKVEVVALFANMMDLKDVENGKATFGDVKPKDWYYNMVQQIVTTGLFSGNRDGNFGVNEHMTRGALADIIARYWEMNGIKVSSKKVDLKDVDGHPYEQSIYMVINAGLMKADDKGKYNPDARLTRDECLEIIYALTGMTPVKATGKVFKDVDSKRRSAGLIESATGSTR